MRILRLPIVGAVFSIFGIHEVAAHHGKDFLIVESCELPHPGMYFLSSTGTPRRLSLSTN